MEIVKTYCECVNVIRRSWDDSRKCFRYTAVMKPITAEGESADIFAQMDMFVKDYRIPLRDEILRKGELLSLAANDGDDDAKLAKWDEIVSAKLKGKKTNVLHANVSVKELTEGEYNSYVLEIGDTSYEVASREIAALQDFESAVGRVKNQVLRACRGQEEEEE